MMANNKRILKLVWDSVIHNRSKRSVSSIQMDLFAHNPNKSVILIYISEMDKDRFSRTIINSHPLHIIDMRPNPRFDFFGYSRKMAFNEFHSVGAKYTDRIELVKSGDVDREIILDVIESEFLKNSKQGPIAFIFWKKEQETGLDFELIDKIKKYNKNWSLSVVS